MSQTVLDFITECLIHANVLGQGETPSNSDASFAFQLLNETIDSLNTERANIYTIAENNLLMTALKQSYQIGPGGADFPNIARPVLIQNAATVLAATPVRMEVKIVSTAEWSAINERETTGHLIKRVYPDYGFPVCTLWVHPIPVDTPRLLFYSWVPFSAFADLTSVLAFPPGYLEVIKYSYLVRLGPGFSMPVAQETVQVALDRKAKLQQFNAQVLGAQPDFTIVRPPEVAAPLTPPSVQA